MKYAYNLGGGGAPIVKKFQAAATATYAGIPFIKGGSNAKGITVATTNAAVGLIGVSLDTATVLTAQQTDNSDPARYLTVIINPLAVYRAKLSGGAAENTALTKFPVSTASTDGLSVTAALDGSGTAVDFTNPATDEGMLFGYDGANAGILRKITSTGSATVATMLVALPNDTVVGDNFLRLPFCCSPAGYETHYPQLTTNLYQVNAGVAIPVDADDVNFNFVEVEMRDASQAGVTNSFVYMVANGHVFSAGLVV